MAVYSWSLTASSNATADASINWQEGQNPSTVNDSARAMMAAIKAGFNDLGGVSALGGSGNTFTLSLSQALPALANGVMVGFFATRANTGAVTLNVDSTGAKPLRFTTGVDLASDEIVSGQFYLCSYNSSTQEWRLVAAGAIPNARLATMATATVKGNVSGSTGTPSDVSLTSLGTAMASAGAGVVPSGGIIMWSGTVATIPTGWYLCNGSNGTPDLRDKFIIGANQDDSGVAKTNVSGSLTQSGGSKDAIAVSHTHTGTTASDGAHTHATTFQTRVDMAAGGGQEALMDSTNSGNNGSASYTSASGGAHTHTFTTDSAGSSGTNANLPPYYALAFIMKA